jgi:hypothetical protein
MKELNQIKTESGLYSKIIDIFSKYYGFVKSFKSGLPVDKDGQAIPLYTYPAIEYLNSIDFSNKRIFEFGSGQSTLYWLRNSMFVASVEHNLEWFKKISSDLKGDANHQYFFSDKKNEYINSILEFSDDYFDVVIIDGSFSRYLCAKNTIDKIKKDGLIVLDNSDWYPESAKLIRDKTNFLQVDFYGFRPSKTNTAVTSLFFSREFNVISKTNRQPNYAIGGKEKQSTLDKEF